MKKLPLFLMLLLGYSLSFTQVISPFQVDSEKNESIPELRQNENVQLYQVLNTDLEVVTNLHRSSPDALELSVPVDDSRQYILELEMADIFTDDFQVKIVSTNAPADVELGAYYKGKIQGEAESAVAISVFEDEISGFIALPGQNLALGKLPGEERTTEHIVYDDSFLFRDIPFECATREDGQGYDGHDLEVTNQVALTDRCVELYFEVDYDIYTYFGSLAATTAYITGLISQVVILYQNENINAQVSEIKVWDVPSPYNGASSWAMLYSFQANTGAFNGDLAQLISFKASGGIAAGFSGLCNPDVDESKCFSSIGTSYADIPTYSWSVMVLTHEFGHLWGSRHTHACVWNGNNTAIDGCSGFTEGPCALPGHPPQGGTIMSYCHLRPVGINFSEGFGPQPGNVIRASTTNAACAEPCCPSIPDWCASDYFSSTQQVLGDGSGVHTYPALSGDFNGDGKTDITFVGQGWNDPGLNIRTKFSNGDGTYTAKEQVLGDGPGVHTYPALTGDFNGDGKTDIAFIGQGWNGQGLNIRTKFSNGDGSYTSQSQVLGDGPGVHDHPALTGDFDGDGKTDIAFAGEGWTGNTLEIRTKFSNGDGTFTAKHQVLGDSSGMMIYPALTGDFDGDGKTDIVFIGQDWSVPGLNIRTKLSNGDGTYTSKYDETGDGPGVHTHPALTGDFNGDGKTDIVFIGQGWNGNGLNIRTKLSNGDGTYSSSYKVLGDGDGVHTYPALLGDFNDDGKTDIAFVGQNWTGCDNGLNIRVKYSLGDSWDSACQITGDGPGVHVYPALVGDFSGDSRSDIVFIGQNWSGTGLNIRTKTANGEPITVNR